MSENKTPFMSVVLPTMQKDLKVLDLLIQELIEQDFIDEIIIIDNSTKGFTHESSKVKVHVPKQNLYINPTWNLGIKLSKNDYIAVLNDDILLPKNLSKQVLDFLIENPNTGLIGLDSSYIICTPQEEMNSYPANSEIVFEKIDNTYKTAYWGSAIFGHRSKFYHIPEKMKLWCGDNYLLLKNIQNNNQSYQIKNCEIKHLGSLTTKKLHPRTKKILKSDICYYANHFDEKYKNHDLYENKFKNLCQAIFSIKNSKDKKHKIITVFGIKLKFKN